MIVVVFLFNLASRGALALVPILFLSLTIRTALAFTIGAIVGFLDGLVDALLLGCGAVLSRWTHT